MTPGAEGRVILIGALTGQPYAFGPPFLDMSDWSIPGSLPALAVIYEDLAELVEVTPGSYELKRDADGEIVRTEGVVKALVGPTGEVITSGPIYRAARFDGSESIGRVMVTFGEESLPELGDSSDDDPRRLDEEEDEDEDSNSDGEGDEPRNVYVVEWQKRGLVHVHGMLY